MIATGSRPGARVSSRPGGCCLPPVPLASVARRRARRRAPGRRRRRRRRLRLPRGDAGRPLLLRARRARADGHDFARAAVAAGAAALVVERWLDDVAAPRYACPRSARRWVRCRPSCSADPADAMTIARGHRHEREDDDDLPARGDLPRRRACGPGVIGTTGARVDGRADPARANDPRGARPPSAARADARRGRGGAWRWRSRRTRSTSTGWTACGLRRGRLHEPLAGPPRLPRVDGGVLRGEGARCSRRPRAPRAVVNADDPWARRLLDGARDPDDDLRRRRRTPTCGRPTSRLDASKGSSFRVDGLAVRSRAARRVQRRRTAWPRSPWPSSSGSARRRGARASPPCAGVPGRVEPVDAGQDFLVVVDYAHTPDSIRRVLQAARPLASGRLIVVFGCGGDRDRAKRPLMGAAATAAADLTIITSDNPRSEDPLAIIADDRAGRARRRRRLRRRARPSRRDRPGDRRGARRATSS